MTFEKIFTIDDIDPVDFFGTNNSYFEYLQKFFSKLKIVARGHTIKVTGEEKDISFFEEKLNLLIARMHDRSVLSLTDVVQIIDSENNEEILPLTNGSSDILVHGKNGLIIKARTLNQKKMVDAIVRNDMLIAIGPAGTGKTYTAVALAVRALKNKEVRRIILTRPAVEAGENLGFLPGDLKDKLDPYLQPLYDALHDMIPAQKLASYLEDRTIEIAPLAFMRGRTLDFAFAILDEAQNATEAQLKMFLTRMGKSAKFVVTGDITQIDLPKNQPSGLVKAQEILKNIDEIEFVYLNEKDVVRHKLVTKIIKAYEDKIEFLKE